MAERSRTRVHAPAGNRVKILDPTGLLQLQQVETLVSYHSKGGTIVVPDQSQRMSWSISRPHQHLEMYVSRTSPSSTNVKSRLPPAVIVPCEIDLRN